MCDTNEEEKFYETLAIIFFLFYLLVRDGWRRENWVLPNQNAQNANLFNQITSNQVETFMPKTQSNYQINVFAKSQTNRLSLLRLRQSKKKHTHKHHTIFETGCYFILLFIFFLSIGFCLTGSLCDGRFYYILAWKDDYIFFCWLWIYINVNK